jgi:hypothetical protein
MMAAMVVSVEKEERNILIPAQKGCQALAKNGEMMGVAYTNFHRADGFTAAATQPLIAIRPDHG